MNESEIASNKKWFAFYTRSRAEKQLFTRLTDRGFISFLPLITRLKQWSDRKKKVKEPLIRSYVFVKIEPERILEILKVPGVVGILKYLGAPAVVKDFEIENLKILVDGSCT
jgi:transcription antitermination factor NusG